MRTIHEDYSVSLVGLKAFINTARSRRMANVTRNRNLFEAWMDLNKVQVCEHLSGSLN